MEERNRQWLWLGLVALLLILAVGSGSVVALVACSASGKPIVVINAPATGSQFSDGQEVIVQSTSTDSKGISKVVLSVDNIVVKEDLIDPL